MKKIILDENISWLIFVMLFFVVFLYQFNIIAMHFLFGIISIMLLVICWLLSFNKKIKFYHKAIILLIVSGLTFIGVFVNHLILCHNPFTYKYEQIDGGIEITGYRYNIRNEYGDFFIEIPYEIKGEKVKSIGEHAFDSSTHIKNLVIPEGVEVIKCCAFLYSDYKTLKLPESLKIIEKSAFQQSSLSKAADYIMLPINLEYIGENSFLFGAKTIIVPKDLELENIDFGMKTFGICYDAIEVATIENVTYALLTNQTATVVSIDSECSNVQILDKICYYDLEFPVTTIGEYSGSYCKFGQITIPNSITTIKARAFINNKFIGARTIYIPKNVIYMEEEVFYGSSFGLTINVEHEKLPNTWSENWYEGSVSWNIKKNN